MFSRPYRKAWTTNANTSSFASRIPTITEPTNDGVINLIGSDNVAPDGMFVLPYGLGANNDAFSLRILGWSKITSGGDPPQGTVLWVPTPILEVSCTMGAAVGIVVSPVLATEAFCDTITVVKQPKFTDADSGGVSNRGEAFISSPADDTVAWFRMPIGGFAKLEFCFDQTTNTPTTNALIRFF